LNLIVAMEQELAIQFALGELDGLQNVGELMDLLERKLAVESRAAL
jgi:acyl carrier protein